MRLTFANRRSESARSHPFASRQAKASIVKQRKARRQQPGHIRASKIAGSQWDGRMAAAAAAAAAAPGSSRASSHTRRTTSLEDSAPNPTGGRSAQFSTRVAGARFDLRRDRRPELKSPTAARAAGVRLLAGRPLESGLLAISRNEKLCGFGHFHPERNFCRA
jgi:hypothetical protein